MYFVGCLGDVGTSEARVDILVYALCILYRRLYIPGGFYFFTVVTAERRPIFRDVRAVGALRSSFRKVRFNHPFEIVAAVVLPDHLHCIWALPDGDTNHPLRWSLIKSATTRTLRSHGLLGDVWQPRYWEHCIRNPESLKNHAAYIHYNPVRHGLVARACVWPWSSFHRWIDQGWYESGWGERAPDIPDDIGRE